MRYAQGNEPSLQVLRRLLLRLCQKVFRLRGPCAIGDVVVVGRGRSCPILGLTEASQPMTAAHGHCTACATLL